MRDDPLDRVGGYPCVEVTSRCEGNLVAIQRHLHGNGSDDDDIVADPLEDLCPFEQQSRGGHDPHQRISVRIASAASSARSPANRQSR